jgi:hypothetical protein
VGGLSEYGSLVGGGHASHRVPANLAQAARLVGLVVLGLLALRLLFGILRSIFRR